MAGNKAIYDTAMKRAHQYAWSSQWERAIKEYKRALAEVPDDPTAQRNVAQCLFRLKQWPEAQQAYEALLAADRNDLFALNRIAEIHLALSRTDLATATYNHLADLYIEGKQLHEAMRALRDISRALPRDIQLHTRILTIAQEIGDKQAELAEHLAISNIALDDNNLGEAAAHAEAASAIDPDNAEVKRWGYAVRRRVAEAAGTGKIEGDIQSPNALSNVMSGLIGAREPDPPEAAVLITRAEQAQEQGDFRAALDLYDKAVEAGARNSHAFYNAGLLNQQMGRPGMAIPYLERAAADVEFATSAYYVQGLCYNILQDHSKAVAAFERALTLIDTSKLTRNEADELIELYAAAAEANLADRHTGRAGSLYATLVKIFKERRWQHPRLPELESKANELYNAGIMSKLEGIKRGSNVLSPSEVESALQSGHGTSSMNTSYMDNAGGDEPGTAFMGGTSSMGTATMGTSSMATSSMATTSMGTTSMGTSSM
jgi:tetratricopeptide (TPR) repeat protein